MLGKSKNIVLLTSLTTFFFFAAYVQEIGRCGRDTASCTATLLYNSNDIGTNVAHLQSEMREYVQLQTCRREYILNYFGFDVDPERSQHDCCDNCRKSCNCNCDIYLAALLDNSEVLLQVDVELKKSCYVSLKHYFNLENAVLSSIPIPQAKTGLSDGLAKKLSEEPYKF